MFTKSSVPIGHCQHLWATANRHAGFCKHFICEETLSCGDSPTRDQTLVESSTHAVLILQNYVGVIEKRVPPLFFVNSVSFFSLTPNNHRFFQVAINWESANLSPREHAILEFALDVMDCEVITEEHYNDLAKQGLDKEDAWDIGAIVALFALSNRMAFTTGMKPNEEFHLLGRIPRDKSK